ncbi:hypothetical protein ZIOFF_069257 [Zingiber officinale]|uniref:Uncharacterized protein n=2 Tax=Zingiber officinale TaxID=94328 RepID=A0A8J5BGP3_ZINOF|nr:hypothetical protein ZIOFF_069257 [Zingiber officinale]
MVDRIDRASGLIGLGFPASCGSRWLGQGLIRLDPPADHALKTDLLNNANAETQYHFETASWTSSRVSVLCNVYILCKIGRPISIGIGTVDSATVDAEKDGFASGQLRPARQTRKLEINGRRNGGKVDRIYYNRCFSVFKYRSRCCFFPAVQTLTLVPDLDHDRLLSRAISRIPPLDRFPVEMASRFALLAFALASLAVSASAQGPTASPSKSPSVAPVKPPAPSPLLPPPAVAPVRPPAAAPLSAPPAPVPAAKSPSLSPPAPPTSDIPAPAPRSSISGVPASAPTAPPPAGNGAADLSFSWIGAFAVAAVAFAM